MKTHIILFITNPQVKLIENPYYSVYNNISSLYVAREHLEDVIILDGDQMIYNPSILAPAQVKLIENPYYSVYNNISSLYVAREHLEDVIILDGDQMIYNPSILAPEFERSGYNAVWTDEETDEWLMKVENGIVKSCSRTGGKSGWQLFSISRWNAEDGKKLKKHLELEFEEKENRQIYWDDVAMFCHPQEYQLGIRKMQGLAAF